MKWKIFFGFLSEKYGKMSQTVKNDENGSDIDEKGQNWWRMKIILGLLWEKDGKMSKQGKYDENG